MPEPRVLTEDECRAEFLKLVWEYIDYWNNPSLGQMSTRQRLSGCVFSILGIIDGVSTVVPAFELIPYPHHDSKEFKRMRGENWWPGAEVDGSVSIAGDLHEKFYEYEPNRI